MIRAAIISLLILQAAASGQIVREVRAALNRNDLAAAETLVQKRKAETGVSPEWLEAHSWLGRGALAAKQHDEADAYAAETRKLALEELKKRPLDAERHLPIALGASIEVQSHVMAARGQRSEAVAFLNEELARWRDTSIRTRIQKNIHLLSLEGKAAPPIEVTEHLGPKPKPLGQLKGRPVLLFLWAHWCGDCKVQAPVLARIQQENPDLVIVGPTQRYGYAARGEDAKPADEVAWIEQVRRQHYAALPAMPVPVSEDNFKNYGVSTTPTLVLIDARGIVRMYHPGKMTYEELAPRVATVAKKAS